MQAGIFECRILAASLCALVFLPVPAFSGESPHSYRNREAGNDAAAVGDYAVAADFYRYYAEDAAVAADTESVRDAARRRIDALIAAGMIAEAEKEFADYELKYPGTDALAISLRKAELLTLKGQPGEALTILRRILPAMTESGLRQRTLAAIAQAEELRKNYAAAAAAYEELGKAAAGTPLELTAAVRRIITLANAKKLSGAELLSLPAPKTKEEKRLLRLAAFYAGLKANGMKDLAAAWKNISEDNAPLNLPEAGTLYSAIGDEAAARGLRPLAVAAYRKAVPEILDKRRAFETLMRLVQTLESLNNPGEAARLAGQAITLFKGDYVSPEIKLRMARVFRNAGQSLSAIELYLTLIQNPAVPRDIQGKAVRECAYLQNSLNDSAGAQKTIRTYFNTPETVSEADFLLADLLLRANRFQEAAEAFQEVASKYPQRAGEALYQASLAWLSAKKFPEAEAVVERLIKLVKKNPAQQPRAIFLKAMIFEAAKKLPEARKLYTEYAGMKGNEPERAALALFKAGKIAFTEQNLPEAVTLFKRVTARYPKDAFAPAAAFWSIYARLAQGINVEDVDGEIWGLIKDYPGSHYVTDALFLVATRYADAGNFKHANMFLNKLLEHAKSPELRARVLLQKANFALKDRDADGALARLDELSKISPNAACLAEAFYLKGDVYKLKGEYEKAMDSYKEALEHNPEPRFGLAAAGSIGDCLFELAGRRSSQELYSRARTQYDTLLARPNLPEAVRVMLLYKSGRCSVELEEIDMAARRYKEASGALVPGVSSAVALWGVKAVEGLVSIAENSPVASHIDAAANAIDRQINAELVDSEQANARKGILQEKKFKP
mgnify:FL=1